MNSTALQLIAEKLRRDRRGTQLTEAIHKAFVFVEHRRWSRARRAERVRRLDVYAVVAEALGILTLTNEFCIEVSRVCVGLGAVPIRPGNQHQFAFMSPRPVAKVTTAIERLSSAEQKRLRDDWERKLRAAGFDDIETPRGDLRAARGAQALDDRTNAGQQLKVKREVGAAFFDQARDYYWHLDRDLRVWELYAIDGLSIREVEGRLGLKRDLVHRIVTRLRAAMGGQREEGEDDDGETDD